MKQIILNVMPEETCMAIMNDDELIAVELERPQHTHLVGNIYKGQVQNVLNGMQAAFVDIGQEKNAFLYVGNGKTPNAGGMESKNTKIHVGQWLPVQITKDSGGLKGPRATTHLSLPGRNVVLMPVSSGYIGMSHKIDDEAEKKRLHRIARELCPENMGMIVRTAAIGQSKEAIEQDVKYLTRIWEGMVVKSKLKGGAMLYRDADLAIRMVRDNFTNDIDQLIVDDKRTYNHLKEFADYFSSDLANRIKLYERKGSILNFYHISEELQKMKSSTVELSSGGFLVIDKTEAMTVIDVNTGKYVGNGASLGETVYQMNLEAADEIMKQLRLRDIGGMILVDFIDMEKPSQKEELLQRLRNQASKDRTKTNVVDITALGLVEITRKKSRQNLATIIYDTCPVCGGTGRIESIETVIVKICRELRRLEQKRHASDGYELQLWPEAYRYAKQKEAFKSIEKEFGFEVELLGKSEVMPGNFVILGR